MQHKCYLSDEEKRKLEEQKKIWFGNKPKVKEFKEKPIKLPEVPEKEQMELL